ncbi:DUF4129 domain-containing protein [Paenibacillus sp. GCM10012307]|uniref:DUF4129 domain-containing protein n=1 Tax=Paenibacillus roseus TaxID=2798579 RepID=A0A934J1P8_9BACL|nr:DUF4129 domain-containing protein [Paenibacillus roseus]MBJ6359959.1 DUF4129 domain-containing protein [Paenibacillus roseus]
MTRMLRVARNAACQGFVEFLLYFPALLVIQVYLLHGSGWSALLLLLLLALSYGLGSCASSLLKLRQLYRLLIFCIVGGAALSYIVYGAGLSSLGSAGVLIGISLYRGARSDQAAWGERFPLGAYFTGLSLYFIASIIFGFVQELQPYTSLLLGCGIASLVAAMYISNSRMLWIETASGEASALPAGVRRHNRLQIGLLLAAVLLLTFLQRFDRVLIWLRDWIQSLFEDRGESATPEQTPLEPGPPEISPLIPGEPREPSVLLMYLEKLLSAIIMIALGILLIWLLYKGIRRVPGAASIIRRWLGRLLNRQRGSFAHDGYVDEVETVLDWNGSKQGKGRKSIGKRGRERWQEDMGANDKVRFLYRVWLRQKRKEGYERLPYQTPRETLDELLRSESDEPGLAHQLTDMYEQARYSANEVPPEEIRRIKEKLI